MRKLIARSALTHATCRPHRYGNGILASPYLFDKEYGFLTSIKRKRQLSMAKLAWVGSW